MIRRKGPPLSQAPAAPMPLAADSRVETCEISSCGANSDTTQTCAPAACSTH